MSYTNLLESIGQILSRLMSSTCVTLVSMILCASLLKLYYQKVSAFLHHEGIFLIQWYTNNCNLWLESQLVNTIVVIVVLVAQSCPTLCNPMDCSPPGSSVHGILQTRIMEWVAIPFSRGFSQPRGQTLVSYIAGGFFNIWATKQAY